MFYCSECESPVGTLTIASDGQAVCGLWLDGQKYHGATIPEKMVPDDEAAGFAELRAWTRGSSTFPSAARRCSKRLACAFCRASSACKKRCPSGSTYTRRRRATSRMDRAARAASTSVVGIETSPVIASEEFSASSSSCAGAFPSSSVVPPIPSSTASL